MDAFTKALQASLGEKGFIPGSDAGEFTSDVTGKSATCLAVVRPTSTEEVSQVVKLCAQHGVAIVPQGGNTNVCGMTLAEADRPTIILNLSRMNRVIDVDSACSTITAESGCTIQTLQEAAAAKDRKFAPDWGARGTAQVGGAVATNGGGQNVFRYGTTREQVLGMQVVMPDGQIWDAMRTLRKDNSGYDIKQLMIGSEGTLGIITKLVFKLHPAQSVSNSMMAVLTDQRYLMDYLNLAREIAGDKLVAFELLNGLGVEKALERYPDLKRPFETRSDWYILLRLAGSEPVDDTLGDVFEQGFEKQYLSDAIMAQSVDQERNLWEIREQMIPMQYFRNHLQCKWDVSVPLSNITEFLTRAEAIAAKHSDDAISYAVGHVGDGNIHYSIFLENKPGIDLTRLEQIYLDEIDELIWSYGGSIVAEHGVGTAYADRMRKQKPEVEYAMMKNIKALFDPLGIMNPGKLLE
ncbi:MAG: FAD-binding oxidoreductase [Rhizobiaceae bacterium]